MNYNTTPGKKCFLCGIIFYAGGSVCPKCEELNREQETRDMLQIRALINKHQADLAALAEESGIELKAVKWYIYRRRAEARAGASAERGSSGIALSDRMYGEIIWVKVEGNIDTPNSELLKEHLNNLIEMGFSNIILDMNAVTFFCSNGIRVVLSTYKALHPQGSFQILDPSPKVVNVMGQVNLNSMILI